MEYEATKPILQHLSGGKSVEFLEVRIWKEGSRFVTAPEFKLTSLWQPVGYDSAHTSWRSARVVMSRSRTRSANMVVTAKSELIERFREHFAPESVIQNLQYTDGMPAIKHARSQKHFFF